jgi:hypothetical protein
MALVLVLIGYRVVLVALSVEGFTWGRFDPPPGGLGSPLLLFLLVPFLIVVRRFIGAGHSWARSVYAVYVSVRVAAIVLGSPWHRHSLPLVVLYLASAALLFTPSARRWFAERRRGRA